MDPLLRRIVALGILTLVAVPVAWSMRSDDQQTVTAGAASSFANMPVAATSAAGSADPAPAEMSTVATVASPVAPALPSLDPITALPSLDAVSTLTPAEPDAGDRTAAGSVLGTAPPAAQVQAVVASTGSGPSASPVFDTAGEPALVVVDPPSTQGPAAQVPETEVAVTEATTTTLSPAEAHSAAVADCRNTYEVAAGDYWIGLAGRSDTRLADLLDVNAATVKTPLYAGDLVCLPRGADIAPATTSAPATTATTAAPATTAVPATTSAPATTQQRSPNTTQPKAPSTTQQKAPSTTVVPASTIPAPPPPPANTYSKVQVEAIVREVWPDDLEDEAVRIATRESNLNPVVRNSCCIGLFQIYYSVHRSWLAQIGVSSASQLYDPRTNAAAALTLYQRSGSFAPWNL